MIRRADKNIICDKCDKIITHQQYRVVQSKKRKMHYCNGDKCCPMKPKSFIWVEQNKLFGLEYCAARLIYGPHMCDIRYDYAGPSNKKPKHPAFVLTIKRPLGLGGNLDVFSKSISRLKTFSEKFCKNNAIHI